MISLKEKIARARTEVSSEEPRPERPPEPSFKLKGLWQRKDDEHPCRSFAARVTGLTHDLEEDRMTLALDFSSVYSEMQWTSKKGEHPEGVKTFFLGDGIYKARIYHSRKEKPEWRLFAVTDGQEQPLSEAQVHHIFMEEE